ncbi:uncharacterized protein LOC131884680 [Tigriopus californicus]|uniref:uncharacterized protein LOC131884680 n=1 Tax=Tigriopus californicus TaxID=6832 RepID=UPI0027D9FB31|nr:uncharacterized protein LOC131884680 [Tigriopus californicus]
MVRRVFLDHTKLGWTVLMGVLLYGEILVYWRAYSLWPRTEAHEARILLVADPQIQGYRDEPQSVLGMITRWDSDRYLSKTFGWATFAYDMHALAFLGDLIDEGSITDDETYRIYVDRFHGIYPPNSAPVMIYTSGDNDIGGEGGDPVTDEKVARFRQHFPVQPLQNIPGTNINVIAANVLSQKASEFEALPPKKEDEFRILVSHFSLMPTTYSDFSRAVVKAADPDVIFSAHFHYGLKEEYERSSGKSVSNVTRRFTQVGDLPIPLNINTDRNANMIEEIIVPTCSYRMGFKEMALGLVRIRPKTGDLIYHNLWLPSRFANLYLYAVALPVVLILFVIGQRKAKNKPRSRKSSFSADYSKLV